MGRQNKSYRKSLHDQAYDRLLSMLCPGESKKTAKIGHTDKDKIFSFGTFKAYKKHIGYFIDYLHEFHPEVTTIRAARKFIPEWLDYRANTYLQPPTQREIADALAKGDPVPEGHPLSAWTVQLEAKALGKLYGISPTDKDYYEPPQRHRCDIKRSRCDVERDSHFSKTNNAELIAFQQGVGLRRRELEYLKGGCLITRDEIEAEISVLKSICDRTTKQEKRLSILLDTRVFTHDEHFFIQIFNGKGGRVRISPITGPHIDRIVERIRQTPEDRKVWEFIPDAMDVHSYRAEYATALYKSYARDVKDIPAGPCTIAGKTYRSAIYSCRQDEAGKKLDRSAMFVVSKALGHNRICIVADNYLRGL